jgi:hypothetical protein
MEILKYVLLTFGVIFVFSTLILAVRSKKAFRFLLYNALIGILCFLSLYFTKKFTGINIFLNEITLFGSAVLGVPAVIVFLFLNLIF